VLDELADLLLGSRCPGCGGAGLGLCAACRGSLARRPEPVLDAVALPDSLTVWAGGRHEGALRNLITAHKDRGSWGLAGVLAGQLALAVRAVVQTGAGVGAVTGVVLVPVPSSPSAVRRRGYDHSLVLARGASARLAGRPPVAPVLRRSARTADQSGLGRRERASNQRGTMRARAPAAGQRCAVLTDDICTTGASLAEAARALREAGWLVLGAAVVAQRTDLPKNSDGYHQNRAGQR